MPPSGDFRRPKPRPDQPVRRPTQFGVPSFSTPEFGDDFPPRFGAGLPTSPQPSDPVDSQTESAAGPLFAAATAREAAFQVLELVREHAGRIADAWQQIQFSAALSPIDRSLSRELAFGVVRRQITLDVVLQKLLKRPLAEIEPALKTVLQLGVYQLIFSDQIPPHAAVHETVELAKKVGRLRWTGFVNGILRAASRLCTKEFSDAASPRSVPVGIFNPAEHPAIVPSPLVGEGGRRPDEGELTARHPLNSSSSESVTSPSTPAPLPPGERGDDSQSSEIRLRFRVLTESVFPDPSTDFLGYFWRAYGFPEWLAARWVKRWTPEELHRLGQWQRMPPPIFLRVNLMKTTRDALLQRFRDAGLQAEPQSRGWQPRSSETPRIPSAALITDSPAAIRVLSGGRIEDWPGFAEGLFSVQDLTAMQAALRLNPTPGSRVLDLCAAPGGKTCHLAELMDDSGEVLAADITPARLTRVVQNAERLGLKSVHALLVSEEGDDLPRGPFDFILADVPCSNTGVIGRRPEVVRQLTSASILELSRLQADLLQRAAERLNVGGRLLYSTCSIEAEENELVIEEFLRHWPEFRLIESELLLPGSPADGGYQALLERIR